MLNEDRETTKKTGHFESQVKLLQKKIEDGIAEAFLPMGFYLGELKKYDEAIEALECYRKSKGADCHYYTCIGIIHSRRDNISEAKKSFDAALQDKVSLTSSQLVSAGSFYYEYDCLGSATDCYKMALKKEPDNFASLFAMALIHLSLGEQERAIPLLLKALYKVPKSVKVLRQLARLSSYEPDSSFHESIDNVGKQYSELTPIEKAELHHAYKCLYERSDNFSKAHEQLQRANKSLMFEREYKSRTVLNVFQRLRSHGEQLSKIKVTTALREEIPSNIFIVGMPRSGTSLLQSILGGHSEISQIGELPFLGKLIGSSDILFTDKIDEDEVSRILTEYKDLVADLYQRKEKYVIDKLPMNFRFIPYILTGLQNAKVIHIHRNKEDVCWSNYYNHLPANGLEYSYTIPTTFDYYNYYEKLMKYYNSFFPNNIYNIQYENLVLRSGEEIKKLTNWLGLQYEENCLDLKRNRTHIKTTSNVQVGDQIQQKISSWHKYREFLPRSYFN